MRLLEGYLLRSFLKVFLILTGGMSLLVSLVEFSEVYPEISEYAPEIHKVGLYLLYSLPRYMGFLLPMLTLLSVIFSLGQASRQRELLIVSASGGRLRTLMKPLVGAGVVITIGGALFMNLIMPESKRLSRIVLDEITHKQRERPLVIRTETWFRSQDSIVRIGLYEREGSIARDIGIYTIKDGILSERLEAEWGILKEDEWELRDVTIYRTREGGQSRYDLYKRRAEGYSLRLLKTETSPDEMDSSRLWRYLKALKASGLKNIKLVADFNLRLSLPLVSLSMILIGIFIASMKGVPPVVGAGIGVVISLFFWFSITFLMSLGYSGVIPPGIAPWIMPVISLIAGIVLYRRIE